MSLLAPLYFLGAAAIGLPILFHLVRQRPKERMTFSSLMFLRPAPPRLTRRSRLDDLLLLLMRALAILLVAAAFTRPFFRNLSSTSWQPPGRDVLLLVDTSASMRQTGVWDAVQQRVDDVLGELNPQDRVGLVAFDRQPTTLVDVAIAPDELSHSEAVRAALGSLEPGWYESDLGVALATAADQLNGLDSAENRSARKEIVLVSDMQAGSRLDMLQTYQWPPDVRLRVEPVAPEQLSNASVVVLEQSADSDASDTLAATGETEQTGDQTPDALSQRRVRVSNSPLSSTAQFSLHWIDAAGVPLAGDSTSANVPPGEMRVFRVPAQPEKAVAIELLGDAQDFDNRSYVSAPVQVAKQLLFIGESSAEPRDRLSYYLQSADFDTRLQSVPFRKLSVDAAELDSIPVNEIALVVVAEPFTIAAAERLTGFVQSGGRVLCVLSEPLSDASTPEQFVNTLTAADDSQAAADDANRPDVKIREAKVKDYALLVDIDFSDALFSIFADPRFSDFSKIRVWSHRQVDFDPASDWETLARFDDKTPALVRLSIGEGQVLLLTTGWQPPASQLALSTKFLPLIARMMDPRAGETKQHSFYTVGDPLPEQWRSFTSWHGPNGQTEFIDGSDAGDAADWFSVPGLYRFEGQQGQQTVAFNLATQESETQPIDADKLETLGIRLSSLELSDEQMAEQMRQMRDVELEENQQWWRWLVLSALGLLVAESWWAGWRTRQQV